MEIDLLKRYPKTKRDLSARSLEKTDEVRAVARQFGKEFFDGDRKYGYGGFNYHPRFWTEAVQDIIKHYSLDNQSSILDVGCGKGFMLYDMSRFLPQANFLGIDISEYAIKNCMKEVNEFLAVGDAKNLSAFDDKSFDLVVSINTVHNLEHKECAQALQEIERVGKHKFITVDAWRNKDQERAMKAWNLTAKTMMHVDEWKKFFNNIGYSGDYYWFTP